MSFTHLHLHTEFSLLDGECRISEVAKRAAELGFTSLAVTDSGVLYGAVDFYKECKSNGIKAIIGCECTVAPRSRFDRTYTKAEDYGHIVLLVKNEQGYKNLIKLVSLSFTDGFLQLPRVDTELLAAYSEGIIALSGGLDGVVTRCLVLRDSARALSEAQQYKRIYGDDFYIEIGRHGLEEEKRTEQGLLDIAKRLSVGIVATNDVHYTLREGSAVQQMLVLIANGATVKDGASLGLPNDSYYLKSGEEMENTFSDLPEAALNTQRISDSIDFAFDFDTVHLPAFDAPGGNNRQYLRSRCYEGLIARKKHDPSIALNLYNQRLEYELGVIETTGFVDYYLIVDDFVRYARSVDIPVGPGRGSGVGSCAAFCMGITDIDPIKNGLLFERFLNTERVSMPDFDIDFCYDRRNEVIKYVTEKYGASHVAQIITFGTLACRAAVRDAGRALALAYSETDNVAKLVGHASTIALALEENKTLRYAYENDANVKQLIDYARALEGRPRHCSTHATGVVITDAPVNEYMPLSVNSNVTVTQYTMNTVADLGLLKIDFLGLRYLTIIKNAENEIRKTEPDFSVDSLPYDDKETYELLSSARTAGVFQLESDGMKSLLRKLRPECMDDITLAISLYRPGPMDSISTCLENRRNPEKVRYALKQLEPILAPTHGVIIYQEQVMRICRDVAGFTYGHADIVRRAMAKKKQSAMESERRAFVDGAVANGIDASEAEKLFDEMSTFAKYAFNKSHAAAYAVTSYRTAYLKAHYTKQYICALMTTVMGENIKLGEYVEDALSFGIKILGPDINMSGEGFTVEGDNIRFGLLGVKNVGLNLVRSTIEERNRGLFTSVENFLQRVHNISNIRMIESLVQCGAFDSFGVYRSRLFAALPQAVETVGVIEKRNNEGQMSLFGTSDGSDGVFAVTYPNIPEYTLFDRLSLEKELTGMYISGHPLNDYSDNLKTGAVSVSEFVSGAQNGRFCDGQSVSVLCIVSSVRNKTTKKNDVMAFAVGEDASAECEITVFPKQYERYSPLLKPENVLIVDGTADISQREDDTLAYNVRLTANVIRPAVRNSPETKTDLFIKVTAANRPCLDATIDVARRTQGEARLYVYFEDEKRLVRVRDVACEVSDVLIAAMSRYMGAENIKASPRKEGKE